MSKEGINKVRRPRQAEPQGMTSRQRASYTLAFKLECVRYALSLPVAARIKPTCRRYPGIEPVQIRKWIKNFQELACRSQGEAHSDVRSCSEVVRLSRGSSEASTPPGKEEAPDSRPRSPVVAERVEKLTKDFDWPLCAMSDAACPAHAETRSSSATSLACNATLSAGSSTRGSPVATMWSGAVGTMKAGVAVAGLPPAPATPTTSCWDWMQTAAPTAVPAATRWDSMVAMGGPLQPRCAHPSLFTPQPTMYAPAAAPGGATPFAAAMPYHHQVAAPLVYAPSPLSALACPHPPPPIPPIPGPGPFLSTHAAPPFNGPATVMAHDVCPSLTVTQAVSNAMQMPGHPLIMPAALQSPRDRLTSARPLTCPHPPPPALSATGANGAGVRAIDLSKLSAGGARPIELPHSCCEKAAAAEELLFLARG